MYRTIGAFVSVHTAQKKQGQQFELTRLANCPVQCWVHQYEDMFGLTGPFIQNGT
jgi:hypothetical protein